MNSPDHNRNEQREAGNNGDSVILCRHLGKVYTEGPSEVAVLSDINLTVRRGDLCAVVGRSGSGKTTLLNLLGGLDQPSTGEVQLAGRPLQGLAEPELDALRNRELGFVYQFHHLLREFSALENVAMPLLIRGAPIQEASEQARSYLEKVGLSHRMEHRPAELSGGERQRVAIARALVGEPRCVLMDEPTGNLDRPTALEVQALTRQLNEQLGTSFIIVTHDKTFADTLHRKLLLQDGQLIEAA